MVPRPENKSVVSSHCLYKVKQAADGSVEKHKARFVARGFSQVEGIDYDETFAPITRYSFIISMLALSTQMVLGMESPPRHVLGLKAQVLTQCCCKDSVNYRHEA